MQKIKYLVFGITLPLLAVGAAKAKTFNVSVEVNSTIGEIPIVINLTQAMAFPILDISDATQNGAYCYTNNNEYVVGEYATKRNSMCPRLLGRRAEYTFIGAPHAVISYSGGAENQIVNGIQFYTSHAGGTVTLDSVNGTYKTNLAGYLKLIDRTLVQDGTYEYTYEINAAYQ